MLYKSYTCYTSHIRASIVQSASVNHQAARPMNELTQEKSHTRASIVQSALPTHQTVGFMDELILERSQIHASIVQSASVSHQAARNMKKDIQKPVLSHESNMIESLN